MKHHKRRQEEKQKMKEAIKKEVDERRLEAEKVTHECGWPGCETRFECKSKREEGKCQCIQYLYQETEGYYESKNRVFAFTAYFCSPECRQIWIRGYVDGENRKVIY